ncbi:hypothetical protein ACHWQZ_G003786 [Mnemiopsis leidyi]
MAKRKRGNHDTPNSKLKQARLTAIQRAELSFQLQSTNTKAENNIPVFLFHASYLKLEKSDFDRMRTTILDTTLKDDRGIKITNTENIPTARAIKLTVQDPSSATVLKDLIANLNQKWEAFSPATDITPNVTRIKLMFDESCPKSFLEHKTAIDIALTGTLGKHIDSRFYRVERPPVWSPGRQAKPGYRRGRTLVHVAADRLQSIEFRKLIKSNPFALSLPGARIETVVDDITSEELDARNRQLLERTKLHQTEKDETVTNNDI